MLFFHPNLVSGAGDGKSRLELRCWGIVSRLVCHLKSNLLHPQVPALALSGLGCSANSKSCTLPAEPELQRGQCGFIKCLSLDKIWDNTVLLCLVEPWLQRGTAVPMCLPGQHFCPSCATTECGRAQGDTWANISEQLCRFYRGSGRTQR